MKARNLAGLSKLTAAIGILGLPISILMAALGFVLIVAAARTYETPVRVVSAQGPINPVPLAVASQGASEIVQSNAVSLIMTTDPLAGREKFATDGGAIEAVGGKLVILDRLGHFLVYDGGNIDSKPFPDLPMHVSEYVAHSKFPLNPATLISHDVRYHAKSGYLYASYEVYDAGPDATHFEISKILLQKDTAVPVGGWQTVFKSAELKPPYYFGHAAGGKMSFAGDTLFFALGDYNLNNLGIHAAAQDRTSMLGKSYKLDLPSGKLTVLSIGLRVPEGLVVSSKGELWETENGERGGDELNLMVEGGNYGWPYIFWGTQYAWPFGRGPVGEIVKDGKYAAGFSVLPTLIDTAKTGTIPDRGKLIDPVFAWVPSIAPTSIVEVRAFDEKWNGDFLVGSLKGLSLIHLRIRNGHVISSESILIGRRIRDVVNARGQIILLTDDGALVFLTPNTDYAWSGQPNIDPRNAYNDVIFSACKQCHSLAARNPSFTVPTLNGVYGRKIAGGAFANYSEGLRKKGGVWDEESLAAFLTSPEDFAPGTTMPNPGLSADTILQITSMLKKASLEGNQ